MSASEAPLRCAACGCGLELVFTYCPRCGAQVKVPADFQDILDYSFSRIAAAEATNSVKRLEALDGKLRDLESELEDLVSHAEAARPSRR